MSAIKPASGIGIASMGLVMAGLSACATGSGSYVADRSLGAERATGEGAAAAEPLFSPNETILAASGNVLLPRPVGLGAPSPGLALGPVVGAQASAGLALSTPGIGLQANVASSQLGATLAVAPPLAATASISVSGSPLAGLTGAAPLGASVSLAGPVTVTAAVSPTTVVSGLLTDLSGAVTPIAGAVRPGASTPPPGVGALQTVLGLLNRPGG